jgi:hypothetical protein
MGNKKAKVQYKQPTHTVQVYAFPLFIKVIDSRKLVYGLYS